MTYLDHFTLTDDLIAHLDPVLAALKDPFIESRYTGFLAVSAVTVYEMAIKTVFQDFAIRKHKVLACFTEAYFDRINGRIKIALLTEDYIKKYGDKYVTRFKRNLQDADKASIRATGRSVVASYSNIITWRHSFAHEGRVPTNPTYDEAREAYKSGKGVIHTLAATMRR